MITNSPRLHSLIAGIKKHRLRILTLAFISVMCLLLLPELALAVNNKGVTLESQLTKANAIVVGKLKVYGVTGATVATFIWAMFKGNIKLAGVAMVTGVTLSLFLAWVAGGMKLA